MGSVCVVCCLYKSVSDNEPTTPVVKATTTMILSLPSVGCLARCPLGIIRDQVGEFLFPVGAKHLGETRLSACLFCIIKRLYEDKSLDLLPGSM